MPKVKRSRKPPPEGWELIEPTLDELDQKMREGLLFYLTVIMSIILSCLDKPCE
jgi:bud site selection protein 31